MEPLDNARMEGEDAGIIHDEFANAARMMLHACERGKAMLERTIASPDKRHERASGMRLILGEHRRRGPPGTALEACKKARASSSNGCANTRESASVGPTMFG